MKNSILKFTLGLNLFLTPILVSAQTSISASNEYIQYMGRVDFSNPQQPAYIYPGVSIKAKFNGTDISAVIHDYGDGSDQGGNFYKI